MNPHSGVRMASALKFCRFRHRWAQVTDFDAVFDAHAIFDDGGLIFAGFSAFRPHRKKLWAFYLGTLFA